MSEYPGYTIDRIRKTVTREQMVLLASKATRRKQMEYRILGKLHGIKIAPSGLDTDGAVSIEEALDRGALKGGF
ncbi:MAG: hypothetical protein ACYDDN_03810 [Candidatus Desulforudaceae bacterium]